MLGSVLRYTVAATVAALLFVSGAIDPASASLVPRYDHVFVVILENHGYAQIIGNPAAPTINGLARTYGVATRYYGITHPSAPNYVAMLGGGTFGVNDDRPYWDHPVDRPSLLSQMEGAGLTWRGYFQGMPYPGYRGYCHPVRCLGVPDSDTQYIAKHNGMIYFNSVKNDPNELANMRPGDDLQRDLLSGHVANLSYIVPDECTDMHGAPPVCVDSGNFFDANDNWLVSTGDEYVAQTVHDITTSGVWSQGNNAIVITFDEGEDNTGCCGTNPGGGHAVTVVVTNRGPRHVSDATPYNHYSLLLTMQRAFGLPCLAGSCAQTIKPMAPLFALTGSASRAVPAALLKPSRPEPRHDAGADRISPGASSAPVVAPAGPPAAWAVVPSPNLSGEDNNLAAVSAGSPDDVWAVGNYYTDANPNVFRNLGLHWDGHTWAAVATPNVGSGENTLFGVDTLADGHAWAVGYYADSNFRIRALTEHYAGGVWHVVQSPQPSPDRNDLFSVSGVSDHDMWAVGGTQQGTSDSPWRILIEHWDGHSWRVVPSPNPGVNGDELFAVNARASNDVWAVGSEDGAAWPNPALVEHWDGHTWRVVPSPPSSNETLNPWAATSGPGGLLATGNRESDLTPPGTLAFTVTSGGSSLLSSENASAGENDLYGVANAAGATWAAGWSETPSTGNHRTLIEQRQGGGFTPVTSPNPGGPGGDNGLGGVTVASDGEAWAVGSYTTPSSSNRTLIEHFVPAAR